MKTKKSKRNWFSGVILFLMLVLLGTVALAKDTVDGIEECGLNPHATYYPLIIEKKWDAQGKHPDEVRVEVDYYPTRSPVHGDKPQRTTITLNDSNNWKWTFPQTWRVQMAEEVQSTGEDGTHYKPIVEYSDGPEDVYGRYLCTLTNRVAYQVTYDWIGNAPVPDKREDYSDDEWKKMKNPLTIPSTRLYWQSEEVENSTRTYGNEDHLVNKDGKWYRFDGWKTVKKKDSNGNWVVDEAITSRLNQKAFYMPDYDILIEGKWTRLYSVTYEWDKPSYVYEGKTHIADEEIKNKLPLEQFYESGTTVQIDTNYSKESVIRPKRFGSAPYKFSGWIVPSEVTLNGDEFTMPEKNITIRGSWSASGQYKVTYEWKKVGDCDYWYQGIPMDTHDKRFNAGDPVTATTDDFSFGIGAVQSKNDSSQGWIFRGWYEDKNCTKPIFVGGASYTMPAHDMTIYGKWEVIQTEKHSLTYKWSSDSDKTYPLGPPVDYSAPHFEGARVLLETEENGTYSSYLPGSVKEQQDYMPNREMVLFEFSGWKIVGNTSGKEYPTKIDSEYSFCMPEEDVTAYGTWKRREDLKVTTTFAQTGLPEDFVENYEPSYGYEGVFGLKEPEVHLPGSYPQANHAVFPSTYSDSVKDARGQEYFFTGWSIKTVHDKQDVPIRSSDKSWTYIMPEEDSVVTAIWKPRTYRVSYEDGCNGTVFRTKYYRGNLYNADTPVFTGATDDGLTSLGDRWTDNKNVRLVNDQWVPMRQGYTFAGWKVIEGDADKWEEKVTECVAYEAQWRKDGTYTLTVQYLDKETNEPVADPQVWPGMEESDPYKVYSPEVAGYEPERTIVEGNMPARDYTETVYYTKVADVHKITYSWTLDVEAYVQLARL